jgi:hypothetical protein
MNARTLLAVFSFWTLASLPASAQDDPGLDGPIQNHQPAFLVRVEVNKTTRDYREGDRLSIRVACEVDAYIYVLFQQADGKVYQIFPNRTQPHNLLKARQAVQIPGQDDLFHWIVAPPFGREVVKVIASRQPIADLANPALQEKLFNPVSRARLKAVEQELEQDAPADWAEHTIQMHTYAKDLAPLTAGANRFGVFFGVSEYEFNAEYELAQRDAGLAADRITPLNLPTSHRNARKLAEVLTEVGRLNDGRVYTNTQATKKQMEETITRWLPSVSRPGDTVLIFFSGHGLQIPDDNGDEPDGLDEVLCPHDQVTGDILLQLLHREKELDPATKARLGAWVGVVKDVIETTKSAEKASAALVRATGVSDDEFAHWLQALDGRQVLVILNACHSGGFGQNEKGTAEGSRRGFDFLQGESARLKDIGQPETAVLTAAAARQSSLVRLERDYSVMPYYLLEVLQETRGPVELTACYRQVAVRMQAYFDELAAELGDQAPTPHQPQLYNFCRKPVFLKP